MIISLIAAMDRNNMIGVDGQMPWHLPDDLRWFVRQTKRKPVVMGRKTFDSIGGKPLRRRFNIVMTRQADWAFENVAVAHSVEQAVAAAGEVDELVVIGGAQIYKLFLPMAHRLYLTRIDAVVTGDTMFPRFEGADWETTYHKHHPKDDRHAYPFDFYILDRK